MLVPDSPSTEKRWIDRLAYWLAVWFGCGHLPKAPGTAGTLGAIPLYLLIAPLGTGIVAITALFMTILGIWAAGRVVAQLQQKDPQIICIDEVAGVFTTWIVAPRTWTGLIVGVVLFRLFDQLKPWPARWAERKLTGGAGVVLDDVAAGVWGALVLLGLHALGIFK